MRLPTWTYIVIVVAIVGGFGAALLWAVTSLRTATPPAAPTAAAPIPTAQAGPAALEQGRAGQALSVVFIALVVGGLYLMWRKQRAFYDRVSAAQRPSTARRIQSAVAELNLTTEAGAPVVEARVHAIEQLAAIARSSSLDHWPIIELLASYIRRAAPLVASAELPSPALLPDVRAALAVLATRGRTYQQGEVDRLNLTAANLQDARLAGAHLEGVDLSGSRLARADLTGALLSAAILTGTDLSGADLRGAQGLTRAQLAAAITDAATQLPEALSTP
ncbi:MAG: pentapeptide repeat-containing protein [Actinobacteria bacterium]|nr:pentapeptide repeat-containing protein [Actinomycetota bacterium]